MTDLNLTHSLKNNLTEGESENKFNPLNSLDVHSNVTTQSKIAKGASDRTSHSNGKCLEVSFSPGTDIYGSVISEHQNFLHFSTDKLDLVDDEFHVSTSDEQSREHDTVDAFDKTLFINNMKPENTSVAPDVSLKYSVDKEVYSPKSKNRNSSNFSIFGQLLNKRQNYGVPSKTPGSINNYSLSTSPSSHSTRDDGFESNDGIPRAQMKTKLRSMWNNVKYGWRIRREVNLKTDSAIWLLGQCYHNKLNDDVALTQDVAEQLRLDLLSKIWLTYRINFPAISGTNIVTDSGWGCMLRCGQMMMAQAFVCHFLQRDWRLSSQQSKTENQLYKTILRWFGDSLSDRSPFSLHHLVSLGKNYGRKAGDWYGPTHAGHVLRDALHEAKKHHHILQQLCMYVASDGIVFKQDIMDLCLNSVCEEKTDNNSSFCSNDAMLSLTEIQDNSSSQIRKDSVSAEYVCMSEDTSEELKSYETACPSYSEFGPPSYSAFKPKWKSLILFVSVRLGNDKINPFYIPCLKSLLAYEHCIGIIGGRPKHALYFIGWQDEKIIHMDPHSCQPAVDVEKEDFNEKSFHSSSIRMMPFSEMDPSCSIGFYFRELEDFQFFIEKFSEITAPLKRNLEYPVFALVDGKRIDVEDDMHHPSEKCIYPPLNDRCADDDDNDYILL